MHGREVASCPGAGGRTSPDSYVVWYLQTALGDLDLSLEPSGTSRYDDLARSAVTVRLARGLEVRVASVDDVIRSKQAAGRPKDLAGLPLLRELQDRLGEMGR